MRKPLLPFSRSFLLFDYLLTAGSLFFGFLGLLVAFLYTVPCVFVVWREFRGVNGGGFAAAFRALHLKSIVAADAAFTHNWLHLCVDPTDVVSFRLVESSKDYALDVYFSAAVFCNLGFADFAVDGAVRH